MTVQARFYVREVTKYCYSSGYAPPAPMIAVKLAPVSGSKGETNKSWASATPAGEISLTIGNPAAAQWFEDRLGKDVAITFDDRPESD